RPGDAPVVTNGHAGQPALPGPGRRAAARPLRLPGAARRGPARRRAGLSGAGRAAGAGGAGARPDPARRRPAGRQGDRPGPAELLGPLRPGPAVPRAGEAGLVAAAAPRRPAQPHPPVPVTRGGAESRLRGGSVMAASLFLSLRDGTTLAAG